MGSIETNIKTFSLFILNPEKPPTSLISSKREGIDFLRPERNTIVSSANNAVRCFKPPVLVPHIVGCVRIANASGSITIIKSRGESGDPRLVPQDNSNGSEVT